MGLPKDGWHHVKVRYYVNTDKNPTVSIWKDGRKIWDNVTTNAEPGEEPNAYLIRGFGSYIDHYFDDVTVYPGPIAPVAHLEVKPRNTSLEVKPTKEKSFELAIRNNKTSNVNLKNISFEENLSQSWLDPVRNETVNLNVELPENVSPLAPGESQNVSLNVSVPGGWPAGNYTGQLVVGGGEYASPQKLEIPLRVEVPKTAYWNLSPKQWNETFKYKSSASQTFKVTNSIDSNTPFNVSAESVNLTWNVSFSPSSVELERGTSQRINSKISVPPRGKKEGNYTGRFKFYGYQEVRTAFIFIRVIRPVGVVGVSGAAAVTNSGLPYKLEVNRKSIDVVTSASDYDSFNDVVEVRNMGEGKKAVTIQLVNTEQLKENFDHLYLEFESSSSSSNVEAPSAFMALSLDSPEETTWIDVGGAGNNGDNNPSNGNLILNMSAYYSAKDGVKSHVPVVLDVEVIQGNQQEGKHTDHSAIPLVPNSVLNWLRDFIQNFSGR